MDSYTDRRVFIPCVIAVQWAGGGEEELTQLSYEVNLTGAKEEFDSISLTFPPKGML